MTGRDDATGVYYDKGDYAGFLTRVMISCVDLLVIAAVSAGMIALSEYFIADDDLYMQVNFIFVVLVSIGYLAILKRSAVKTVGYRLTGVKVVDLKGERPGVFTMVLRALLIVLGPFELILDILWLTSEPTKQTLRDKYVGTYVVKKDAVPLGRGPLKRVTLGVMGWNLMYREVRVKSDGAF